MFRKKTTTNTPVAPAMPIERVTTVLGSGTTYKGSLSGSGGARIEGAFEGEINLRGMLVIGATGRVTCPHVKANVVIVAGALRGDITAEKVEIRSSGRVWGDVITAAFSTEEGAFLRGQIQMEEKIEMEPLPQGSTQAGQDAAMRELQPFSQETAQGGESAVDAAPVSSLVQEQNPQAAQSLGEPTADPSDSDGSLFPRHDSPTALDDTQGEIPDHPGEGENE